MGDLRLHIVYMSVSIGSQNQLELSTEKLGKSHDMIPCGWPVCCSWLPPSDGLILHTTPPPCSLSPRGLTYTHHTSAFVSDPCFSTSVGGKNEDRCDKARGPVPHTPQAGARSGPALNQAWSLLYSPSLLSHFPTKQFLPKSFPCFLSAVGSSTRPYLMNFSMTSSTHICSLKKLMP